MEKKKWASPQAIIVMAIVALIFIYIGLDMSKTKPAIRKDLIEIRSDYINLSEYLNEKLPEIDSTLKIQADQISKQGTDISILNGRVKNISDSETTK